MQGCQAVYSPVLSHETVYYNVRCHGIILVQCNGSLPVPEPRTSLKWQKQITNKKQKNKRKQNKRKRIFTVKFILYIVNAMMRKGNME